jgi:hypothetical protein
MLTDCILMDKKALKHTDKVPTYLELAEAMFVITEAHSLKSGNHARNLIKVMGMLLRRRVEWEEENVKEEGEVGERDMVSGLKLNEWLMKAQDALHKTETCMQEWLDKALGAIEEVVKKLVTTPDQAAVTDNANSSYSHTACQGPPPPPPTQKPHTPPLASLWNTKKQKIKARQLLLDSSDRHWKWWEHLKVPGSYWQNISREETSSLR